MTTFSVAMYDAFTAVPYCGSQAAVVLDAGQIAPDMRARIAREIGAPATSFVDHVDDRRVKVQFFSTVMELPMCGHGTICLVKRLVDAGLLPLDGARWHTAVLDLPKGDAQVAYRKAAADRVEVMLEVAAARLAPAALDMEELARLLGVSAPAFSTQLPAQVASADFLHLCLPMRDLAAIRSLSPDFAGLAAFCVANGLETVAAFTTEVENPDCHLHVRDFCPAVGVDESAAAGTTNAALAAYLFGNGIAVSDSKGHLALLAEQGIELGRPSRVTTRMETTHGQITRLQVGGVAAPVIEGQLHIDSHTTPE